MDDVGSVTQFFERLKSGDAAAAEPLWQRFFPRLSGLARKALAGRTRRVADADDVIQSAFASFCQRAKAGDFQIGDRDDLWNLLGVMTARKAQHAVRHEMAAKRGGGRVVGEGALTRPDGSPMPLDEAAAAAPAADFDLHSQELLDQLDEECRTIAVHRLLGFTNREIAERLDCTERKIERKLNLIRMTWENAGTE